jgi:hypothetical protein
MRLRVVLVAILFACAGASFALAQEQSGSIEGVVKDASGGVLPGVTVEARSQSVVGVSTAITDAQGAYRFPALPPGRYTLTASLQGFGPAKTEATLSLGQLLKINLALEVGNVTETVQVRGESPLIDVKQNASFANIEREIIARMPKGRDFTSVVKVAPGAQSEDKAGGLQIDGASGSENRFIVDGMDTTSGQTGLSGKTILVDFIQEVQVKSSGYNAEYGGATGGVINAITKSGGNQLRGSLGAYLQTYQLLGKQRESVRYSPWDSTRAERGLLNPTTELVQVNPVAEVGGPLLKDKAWFFAGLAYESNSNTRDAIFVADPAQTKRHFAWYDRSVYFNSAISTQLGQNLRVRVATSNQRQRTRGTAPALQPENGVFANQSASSYVRNGMSTSGYTTGTFDTDPAKYTARWTNQGSDQTNDTYSANADWVITPRLFVNATAGYFRTNNVTPESFVGKDIVRTFGNANGDSAMNAYAVQTGRAPLLVPASLQLPSGSVDNISNSGSAKDINDRVFFNANLIAYASFWGQHLFKAGVRFERFGNDVNNGQQKPNISLTWGQCYSASDGRVVCGKYGYYTLSQNYTVGNVHSNNVSLWLQDSWTIGSRLTVNAGVRAEYEHVPSYTKASDAVDMKWGFGDKIAPRIGFAYDFKGDGKWKAYGSFGLFYDIMKLSLPRSQWGATHWINYFWTLDTPDWRSINCGEGPTGCPGTFIEEKQMRPGSNQYSAALSSYFGRPTRGVDPAMKPARTGELVVGADHQLAPTVAVGLRYVHKWVGQAIEDIGIIFPGVGELYINGNPGYGMSETMVPAFPQFKTPKPQRDYDGLEVRIRRQYANRWSAELSYTLSRLYGNYNGLANSDEVSATTGLGRTNPNRSRAFDSPYMSYDQNLKAVYGLLPTDRPHVVKVQGTYELPWGTSLGLYGTLMSGNPITSEFTYQSYPIYYLGRGNLGRSPTTSQVDLQLAQDIRLGGQMRLTLAANVTNLFDQAGVIGYYSRNKWRDSTTFPGPDATFFSGPWNAEQWVALRRASGATMRDEQLYMVPNSFQGRRELRFQMKLSF